MSFRPCSASDGYLESRTYGGRTDETGGMDGRCRGRFVGLHWGQHDLDRPKRVADYREVQRILARDVPVVSLWHEDNVAVMGKDVEGFEILPTAQLSSLARTRKTKR